MSGDFFTLLCQTHGLPAPEREVAFHASRKWRLDYAWASARIALEQEGGLWTRGRHVRAKGFERDCEKYAEATLAGWRVFRASPRQLEDGTALGWVRRALAEQAQPTVRRIDGRATATA